MGDTMKRLQDVFRDIFGEEDLEIRRETAADDVDGWDSLMHVNLVVAVENAFGIRFAVAEMASLADVGEWIDLIDAKTGTG